MSSIHQSFSRAIEVILQSLQKKKIWVLIVLTWILLISVMKAKVEILCKRNNGWKTVWQKAEISVWDYHKSFGILICQCLQKAVMHAKNIKPYWLYIILHLPPRLNYISLYYTLFHSISVHKHHTLLHSTSLYICYFDQTQFLWVKEKVKRSEMNDISRMTIIDITKCKNWLKSSIGIRI